ncbi:TPA: HRDC domain-containing protein, partial [Mannheimia haemolytica]|nr:HRDC domain-containing protein [Mannheimia haemolytica]
EMAEFLPTSKVEMLEINGVGERKFERFGQAFMSLIKEYQNNRK